MVVASENRSRYLIFAALHLNLPAQPRQRMIDHVVGAVSTTRQGCAHVAPVA